VSARKARLSSDQESSALIGRAAFVGMFDAHAAHLYDYCLTMLGEEAEAASATRVTLIAAYMLGGRMNEPDRLRAWMFALARRECPSESPTRKEPWVKGKAKVKAERPRAVLPASGNVQDDVDTGEIARIDEPAATGFEAEIRRAVRLMPRGLAPRSGRPDQYGEVLGLVHRHGIAPSELPSILDISAEAAQDLLAAAPVMTSINAGHADTGAPLASLPGSVWRETASVVFDAGQSSYCQAIAADAGRLWADGFPPEPAATTPPSSKKMAMTSVGLAAALLAPAALGAGLYAVFARSPHGVTRSHDYAIVPPATTHPAVAAATSSTATHKPTHARRHARTHARVTPSTVTFPTSSVTYTTPRPTPTSHKPKSSPPVITGPPGTVGPSPTTPGHTGPTPTPTSSLPLPSPTG